MKKVWVALMIAVAFLFVFAVAKTVNAVPGQLNYDIPITPQEQQVITTVVTDTKALDECTNKYKVLNISEQTCKNNIAKLERANEDLRRKNAIYLIAAIAAGALAMVFGVLFFATLSKKKMTPTASPSEMS